MKMLSIIIILHEIKILLVHKLKNDNAKIHSYSKQFENYVHGNIQF